MKNNFQKFLEDPENKDLIKSIPEDALNILVKAKEGIQKTIEIKQALDKKKNDIHS